MPVRRRLVSGQQWGEYLFWSLDSHIFSLICTEIALVPNGE
jgi:hypothetical protein